MSTAQKFDLEFASELKETKATLNKIIELLKTNLHNVNENDMYDLHLIYSELLCNAVIHGNKQDSSKSVKVLIEIENNSIYSVVTDQGPGFNYKKIIEGATAEERLFMNSGRGLNLVGALADKMEFNESGNKITFVKKVASCG